MKYFAALPAWRALRAMPNDAKINLSRLDWALQPKTKAQFHAFLREKLHTKISNHLPWYRRGRKWTAMEQVRMMRDCRAVRDLVTRRLRVYQFETAEVRRRFSHLLSDYRERW